jgi:hypothetical protein
MTITKTVTGYFGKPKQIGRDDFISQWRNAVADCQSLAETSEEYEEIKLMIVRVAELAGNRWDRMKA